MADVNEVDWSPLRALARRVLEQGEALELRDDTRALLRASAREFAIRSEDAENALASPARSTVLLREIWRRMEEGSHRLSEAETRADELEDAGDFAGARESLEDVLAVEEVPFYRELAQRHLQKLARLEAVAATGQVDLALSPWAQVRVLARRLQQGAPLDLREDMRAFLQHIAAPSVAISESEAQTALRSEAGAETLLGQILKRIDEGRERIRKAMSRMMDCREEGQREEALQALRDVLAVEVVPKYRQMAQEHLDHFDEPAPEG